MNNINNDSLVLYKTRPARVLQIADKVEIECHDGKTQRVRLKDIQLLHVGPLKHLDELTPQQGELQEAWEILVGGSTTLSELTELAFEEATPAATWTAWQWVQDDLYFYGKPDQIGVREADEVDTLKQQREAKANAKKEWQDLLSRLQKNTFIDSDRQHLLSVEKLAHNGDCKSPILRDLGHDSTPQNAHTLLLKIGYWPKTYNPYPHRFDLPLDTPLTPVPALPDETRRDLTHLAAYAIDDRGNQDPDDAISIDEDKIWVHVADVAALVTPDSELDLLARGRAANLYLPEMVSPMLPPVITEQLGLGLQTPSPALSFCLALDSEGQVQLLEVTLSWVNVTRISYDDVEHQLTETPFAAMLEYSQRYHNKRIQQGAFRLNLPEAKIKVHDDKVSITPYLELKSRDMVAEMMLMTGEAVAKFALTNEIPIAFSTQPPPESNDQPQTLAEMFAFRKQLKRSQLKSVVSPHAGLGLEQYTQVTSPLRRYLDLVTHQQLRAFLQQQPLLNEQAIVERVGSVEAIIGSLRRAERLSNQHWTLLYLKQQKDWQGQGIVVEDKGHNQRVTLLIPELAIEARLNLKQPPTLDAEIPIQLTGVDIPELMVYFRSTN